MATPQDSEKLDRQQDDAVEDSFPASDPPANSGIAGPEPSDSPAGAGTTPEPTGTPISDRHGTETAHHEEPDVKPTKG